MGDGPFQYGCSGSFGLAGRFGRGCHQSIPGLALFFKHTSLEVLVGGATLARQIDIRDCVFSLCVLRVPEPFLG